MTATNFELDPSARLMTLGSGNSVVKLDGDIGMWTGHSTSTSAPFIAKRSGQVTASTFLMKGGTITSDVTILGSVTANTILTPAEIGGSPSTTLNASSSIDAGGFAKFMSASIGGWTVNTDAIYKLDSGVPGDTENNGVVIAHSGGTNGKGVIEVYDGTTRRAALGNWTSNKYGIYAIEGSIAGWTIASSTIYSGVSSHIKLDATNKRFSINSNTYGNEGIQLEYNSGTPRFHVGDGSSKFIKWDGSDFTVNAGNITIDASGNVTASNIRLSGNVSSSAGNIGGWNIAGTLSSENIILDPATPKIQLGSKASLTDSNTGFYAGTDGIALGASSVFKVTSAGAVSAGNLTLTGGSLSVGTGNNIFKVDSNGNMWLGHASQGSAPFQVSKAGAVTASNMLLEGTARAVSFAEKLVTVTVSNRSSYMAADSSTGVELMFDGSGGGEVCLHMQLDTPPFASSVKPITKIAFPDTGTGINTKVTIIVNCSGVSFSDNLASAQIAASYGSIVR